MSLVIGLLTEQEALKSVKMLYILKCCFQLGKQLVTKKTPLSLQLCTKALHIYTFG